MVLVAGFEPAISSSQMKRLTSLGHTKYCYFFFYTIHSKLWWKVFLVKAPSNSYQRLKFIEVAGLTALHPLLCHLVSEVKDYFLCPRV